MPIAKITGQGLAAITCSVALLWGCIIRERVERRKAFDERERIVHEVKLMQRRIRSVPVSDPSPFQHHRPHVAAG
jgi:hypothetical protein